MKVKEVKSLIYTPINEHLKAKGFIFKKSKELFERKFDWGKQTIGMGFINYNPEYDFSFFFSTRINEIENIVNQYIPTSPPFQKDTFTSITQLAYFLNEKNFYYKIQTAPEIETAVKAFLKILDNKIFDFFDEFSDPIKLEAATNRDTQGANFSRMHPPHKAVRGLILAKKYNPAMYHTYIDKYRKTLEDFPQNEKEQVENVIQFLNTM